MLLRLVDSTIAAIERVSQTVGAIGGLLIGPLIVAMVYEVLARHLFDAPTFWAYEAGYMMSGTCYLFGMCYCMKRDGHVRVDFIYNGLGRKGQALVDLIGYLVLLMPVVIWISYALFNYALRAYHSGEVSGVSAWNPVVWPFRVMWFIAFCALTLQTIAMVLRSLRILSGGEPPATDSQRAQA